MRPVTSSSARRCPSRVLSRMRTAIDEPPKSRREYRRLINDYTKVNAGKRIAFSGHRSNGNGYGNGGRVWAVSDLDVECHENKVWLDKLQPRLKDAVIVAGNVAGNLGSCTALSILTGASARCSSRRIDGAADARRGACSLQSFCR